jgi:hypothetical protein
MNFTAPQQRAIGFGSANLYLSICAGSGKIEVVAQRFLHSIAFAMTLKIDRGEILSATGGLGQMLSTALLPSILRPTVKKSIWLSP